MILSSKSIAKFKLINLLVSEIWIPDREFGSRGEDDGNTDVIVILRNGKQFSFTAFTPKNVEGLLQLNGWKSFVSPGLLIVSSLSEDCILDAIESCLRLSERGGIALEHFGILQE